MPEETQNPSQSSSPDRTADLARAVALGRKRSEQEAARKKQILERKEKDAALSRSAQDALDEKRSEAKEQRKGFRKVRKERDAAIEADKKRRSDLQKLAEEEKAERDAKRKKEQMYMGELHELSRMKIAQEQRKNRLKADYERDKQHAEFLYRSKVEQAAKEEREIKTVLDREARQKKSLLEEEIHKKLFDLDSWKRSQSFALDEEERRLGSPVGAMTPVAAGRLRAMAMQQVRVKRKKLDTDYNDKKRDTELSFGHRRLEIENDLRANLSKAELDHRHAVAAAERERTMTLEQLAIALEKGLKGG